MKKVFAFVVTCVTLLVCSCSREVLSPIGQDDVCPDGYYIEELFAEYPQDPATRTAFNEETGRFAWTEGDELAFHLSNGEYVTAPIDPSTSKVKLYLPIGVTRDNYAVYPADAVVDEAAVVGNMKVTLPDTYDIQSGLTSDYVPTPLVAWNDAENHHLKFEHVGGLLQVNLTVPAGVKTAKLNMGKVITGTFSLEDGTGNGIIAPGEETNEGLTFVVSESGMSEPTAVKLLAPLPTGTYELFEINYDNGYRFVKDLSDSPWVFTRSSGKKVTIDEDSFFGDSDFFWFEALEAGSTVAMDKYVVSSGGSGTPNLFYSIDDRRTWHEWDMSAIELPQVGDRVYFYGTNTSRFSSTGTSTASTTWNFVGTGKLAVGGKIYSLYSSEATSMIFRLLFKDMTALYEAHELVIPSNLMMPKFSNVNSALSLFDGLFYGCSNLQTTPELPATVLVPSCYANMFAGCSSLQNDDLPVLPAENLSVNLSTTWYSSSVYAGMFSNCTGLTEIPDDYLPSTHLGSNCYGGMFSGCSNLVKTPVLPAMRMATSCYSGMFRKCTSLEHTPELPSVELNGGCYQQMFEGCTALKDHCDLPAKKVPDKAYYEMFGRCTALETAGIVYAEDVAPEGCRYMYYFDSSLKNIQPVLWVNPVSLMDLGYYKYSTYRTFNGEKIYDVGSYQCGDMYRGCGLTSVPQLPNVANEIMGHRCFEQMFMDCVNMTGTITLPSKVLNYGVYGNMFYGCKNLEKAIIMAEDADWPGCMIRTFYGCSKLSEIEVHFDHWPYCPGTDERPLRESSVTYDTNPLESYASGVSRTGIYYKLSSVETQTGVSRIPSGWTVNNIDVQD